MPRLLLPCVAALAASASSAFAPRLARSAPYLAAVATRGGGAYDASNNDVSSPSDVSRPSASDGQASTPASPPGAESDAPSELNALLEQARRFLSDKDADGAFATLAQAYRIDPTSTKVAALFQSCLGLKVELAEKVYYGWKENLDANDNESVSSALSERELRGLFQDRMGLSSLYIDRELYDEAGVQLRTAIEEATFWLNFSLNGNAKPGDSVDDFSSTRFGHWQPQIDRARYLVYRTNAACCHWDTYFEDGDRLRQSVLHTAVAGGQDTRLLHPFDALKFPCISLELAWDVAGSYARRALQSVGVVDASEKSNVSFTRQSVVANRLEQKQLTRKMRIGYISPDFTSKHPLAFLMQHVFRCHDKSQFVVHIYSVSSSAADDGPEVRAIRESSDHFTYLSPSSMSPVEMYRRILDDELDILVDLCGYAGTSVVSEIMASRCLLQQAESGSQSATDPKQRCPFHVSYMGFPGSVGSSRVWDFSVFDPIVVPLDEKDGIRQHYSEALVYMPHCYFVNSHRTVVGGREDGIMLANEDERRALREKYGIDPSAFVYCCHSRPDKIDPTTFRTWMQALKRVRSGETGNEAVNNVAPVLWLLRSGDEMEQNLRRWVRREFGEDAEDCLVFAGVAERSEHLQRLGAADVFLDTPAYNAHTLGCDALYMDVPMISLLRELAPSLEGCADSDGSLNRNGPEIRSIATEKLASRVGASLLQAISLDELAYPDMDQYEDAMVRCALDKEWFGDIRQKLLSSKDGSPLFDTERWVRNLEASFRKMVELEWDAGSLPDIVVSDSHT
ncbi:hypothetical protein ACHAXT_002076 [Thalassiosira profunda]